MNSNVWNEYMNRMYQTNIDNENFAVCGILLNEWTNNWMNEWMQ